jgi:hypothetical protein
MLLMSSKAMEIHQEEFKMIILQVHSLTFQSFITQDIIFIVILYFKLTLFSQEFSFLFDPSKIFYF